MKKIFILILFCFILSVFFSQCHTSTRGEQLAKQHCQSCHMLPEPTMLDKQTWVNYVLPKMGTLLGFTHFDGGGYVEGGRVETMPLTDWEQIVRFYLENAPDTLTIPE